MGNVSSGSRDEDSKSSVSIHYPSNNDPSNNNNNGTSNHSSSTMGNNSARKFRGGRLNFLTGTNQVVVTTMTNSNQVVETPRSDQQQQQQSSLNTSRSNSPLMIGTSLSGSTGVYHHQASSSGGSTSLGTFQHHHHHHHSYTSSGGGNMSGGGENLIIPIHVQSMESLQVITELYYSVYLPHDWKVQLLQYGNTTFNNTTPTTNTNHSPPPSVSASSSTSSLPPNNVHHNSFPSQTNAATHNQPSTTTNSIPTTNNIQQKIFFSSFDRNFEKDFLEIYVTFSPHSIEKEAQLAIEDIQELSRNDTPVGGLQRMPSSSMMRQVSSPTISNSSTSPSSPSVHSRMLEPKLVKGITHVVDKHIQPEKQALYFIIQFQHELLPQKLLYKKIYFIQDLNGLLYCLMLTTTRRESENILGYSMNLTVNTKGMLIPSINIQQELFNGGNGNTSTNPTPTNQDDASKLTVSPPSSNRNSGNMSHSSSNGSVLVDSVDKTVDCTSPSNEIISKRKNSNTISQNNSKKVKKRLSSAFSSIGGSMFEEEDADEIFGSNLLYSNLVPPIDGAAWIDILVRDLFTVKSISDLKRKTSNLDGDGVVLSVPMCFIPSLRIDSDSCSGEEEMVRHFGVGDFGKKSHEYKLILYHPIQYLANKNSNQRSRETLENIFVTYVNFGNHKNNIADYAGEDVARSFETVTHDVSLQNSGKLLEQFYTTTFKEQVLRSCTIVSEKDTQCKVSLYSQQSNTEMNPTDEVPLLKTKVVELASTTYSGHTLKKICYLVERNDRIWIFTYSSTSNLIAREIFEIMMSEVKYYKIV